jgi:ribose transport system ATP-binding protein
MMVVEDQLLLQAKEITKDFPGVRALDNVDFDLRRGEIHAILGENGAGKSTLIKILGGVYLRDTGSVHINGDEVEFRTPSEAKLAGLRVIHQELNLLPLLSVEENILLGQLPTGSLPGFVGWGKVRQQAKEVLGELQVTLDLRDKVGDLNAGEQQLIEIAQALVGEARILVMDEPTAALNDTEIEGLFALLRRMADQGIGIIYITHRIAEVFEIANRVTVLRDGLRVGTVNVSDTKPEELVRMMVGRSLDEMYPRERIQPGETLLEVRSLNSEKGLHDVSFTLRTGEILGVYGLLGSGRSLLAHVLFGDEPKSSGEVLIKGEVVNIRAPSQARSLGMGYVPMERKTEGLVEPLTVRKNLTLANLQAYGRSLFLDERDERERTRHWVDRMGIRTPSIDQSITSLSGGNQQKVIVSRWLETQANIMIMHEPTRGIDVGAKVEIYTVMDELCKQGVGILMFSSEMTELLAIADRILVMSEGHVTGEFSHTEATQELLMERAVASREAPR